MIIVSQDKTEIINFNNVLKIEVIADEIIIFYKNDETAGVKGTESIGIYKTEERAKEVLQEIIQIRSDFEYYKCIDESERNELDPLMKTKYKYFDTYEMPEE